MNGREPYGNSSNNVSFGRRGAADDAGGEEGHPGLFARYRLRMVRFLSLRLSRHDHRRAVLLSVRRDDPQRLHILAFAAGFLVRPFGAIFFGRIGDLVGRKYTFLVTILIMGFSTFLVGLLPSYAQIGWVAPVVLIARMLQGLALGGEYGGAAVYVAEHAPVGRRGFYTSFIQITATVGLLLSLVVILVLRTWMGEQGFQTGEGWPIAGWRIPFLLSVVLLAISVGFVSRCTESPAFKKMKDEGAVEGAAEGSFRPMEQPQDGAHRPDRRCHRPGGGYWYTASSTPCSSSRAS